MALRRDWQLDKEHQLNNQKSEKNTDNRVAINKHINFLIVTMAINGDEQRTNHKERRI